MHTSGVRETNTNGATSEEESPEEASMVTVLWMHRSSGTANVQNDCRRKVSFKEIYPTTKNDKELGREA